MKLRIPLLEKEDAYEFRPMLAEIEERPVNPLGRAIMVMIIATIAFFIAWSYFGQIDIVVSSRGTVIAEGENKVLQPLDTGVVSKILVREGDQVRKGQALIQIDPSTTQPELKSTDENLRYSELEIDRINATLGQGGFSPRYGSNESGAIDTQRRLYEAAVSGLDREKAAKEAELRSLESQISHTKVEQQENESLLRIALEKNERFSRVADIIAKEELEKLENEVTTYKNNIEQEGHKLVELEHRKSQTREEMGKIEHQFREKHLQDLGDKQKQATELRAKLQELTFKNAKQVLTSPVDGHIDRLLFHTVGGVVTPAEKLMSIVPAQAPLVVKAEVQNQDIGFVEKDQDVSIKVDTFEFQKYGMFNGKVRLISKDSHEDEQKKEAGKLYNVYVTPTTHYLTVEGRKEPLKPGMTVTAEVKVGKRRIIEFFIYPLIKYWSEGMSVR